MLVLPFFLANAARAESTIDAVMERGVLRVGFSTFVPWAMQDKNGEYIGFEIDVAKKLAEDLGVELQLVPTSWDGIIPALLANKFDVIIGGMGVTTKRNLTVNFTVPYDYNAMDITANKEKAGGLKSLADFNNKAVVVAVRNGSAGATFAKKFLPEATVRFSMRKRPPFRRFCQGALLPLFLPVLCRHWKSPKIRTSFSVPLKLPNIRNLSALPCAKEILTPSMSLTIGF